MSAGRLVCLGTPQHLRNRFGAGYRLEIRCGEDETSPDFRETSTKLPRKSSAAKVLELIAATFPSATLQENHCGRMVRYWFPEWAVNVPCFGPECSLIGH
jgi:hypothetical protein